MVSRSVIICLCALTLSRSEEHTSELQSQSNLVCRLLLEKKNRPETHLPAPGRASHRTASAHSLSVCLAPRWHVVPALRDVYITRYDRRPIPRLPSCHFAN